MGKDRHLREISKVVNKVAGDQKAARAKRYRRPWALSLIDRVFPFANWSRELVRNHRAKYDARTDEIIKTAIHRSLNASKSKRGHASKLAKVK